MFGRWVHVKELKPSTSFFLVKKGLAGLAICNGNVSHPTATNLYHRLILSGDVLHEWSDFDRGRLQEGMSGISGQTS